MYASFSEAYKDYKEYKEPNKNNQPSTRQLNGVASQHVPVIDILDEVINADAGVQTHALRLEAAIEYRGRVKKLIADAQKALKTARDALGESDMLSVVADFKSGIGRATKDNEVKDLRPLMPSDLLPTEGKWCASTHPPPSQRKAAKTVEELQKLRDKEVEELCPLMPIDLLPSGFQALASSYEWSPPTGEQMFKAAIDALATTETQTLETIDTTIVAPLKAALRAEKKRALLNMAVGAQAAVLSCVQSIPPGVAPPRDARHTTSYQV